MAVKTPKKKAFSRFTLSEAYKQLSLTQLIPWAIEFSPVSPTEAFQMHLERLQAFDIQHSEEGKKLLIEAIQAFKPLKFWKGANLESDVAHGAADYLLAENRGYLEAPFLCVIEAKKDDFEQGLAQCLVEMQACQWSNQVVDRNLDVFGIVTNGEGWKFYKFGIDLQAYETLLYSISELENILGQLHAIFQCCESQLQAK